MALKSNPPTKIRHKKETGGQANNVTAHTAEIVYNNNNTFDHLNHLQAISNRLIFAYTDTCFYVFDMKLSTVVLWNNEFPNIDRVKVIDRNIIMLFTKDCKVFMFQMQQLHEVFTEMLTQEKFVECGGLLLKNVEYFEQKTADRNFLLNYSILISKLEYATDSMELLTKLKSRYDDLVRLYHKKLQETDDIRKLGEMTTNGKRLESGVYLVDNSYAAMVKSSKAYHQNKMFDDIGFMDDQNDDNTEIVLDRTKFKTSNKQVPIEALNNIETKKLSQDEKVVRNLFFIYKSLKMSNCNSTDQYAEIFDSYDLSSIRGLLQQLERLILENETISDLKARQHCSQIYLNYLNPDTIWQLDSEARDYIFDCFMLLNAETEKSSAKRCTNCYFPLIIETHALNQEKLGQNLITYFWSHDQQEKCFDMIKKLPYLLNFILEFMLAEKLNGSKSIRDRDGENNGTEMNKNLCDILFACANKMQFETFVQNKHFQTTVFWDDYMGKLIKLRHHGQINCCLCGRLNDIDWNRILGVTKAFYTYDYVFNQCADHLKGLIALELCKKYAKSIPCDAVGKQFYLKCLLNA